MKRLQFLGRQGIAFRGNDDGNDNFIQLLLLWRKDHPCVIQRLQSKESFKKLYTHAEKVIVTFIPSCVTNTQTFQIKNNFRSVFVGLTII